MTILAAAVADEAARPVIVMTAYATVASAVTAVREGAFDYLTKPFTADQLLVAVERAARYRGLTVENRSLRRQVARTVGGDGILGSSPVMARLLEQATKVAPTDASVLITGESGTGKDLVARFIHAHSLRSDGPFIAVDCAAMPDGLLESELFGHERGAFTGAVQRTKGLAGRRERRNRIPRRDRRAFHDAPIEAAARAGTAADAAAGRLAPHRTRHQGHRGHQSRHRTGGRGGHVPGGPVLPAQRRASALAAAARTRRRSPAPHERVRRGVRRARRTAARLR